MSLADWPLSADEWRRLGSGLYKSDAAHHSNRAEEIQDRLKESLRARKREKLMMARAATEARKKEARNKRIAELGEEALKRLKTKMLREMVSKQKKANLAHCRSVATQLGRRVINAAAA